MSGRWPDFFVVGAPKCGTTSLHAWLSGHPQLFLPETKEPTHFGVDLDPPLDYFVRDEARYLALFEDAAPAQRVGEASVLYLASRRAPAEIRAACGAVRIVVAVRDPVEMMYAWHSQLRLAGAEPEADFLRAVARPEDALTGPCPLRLRYRDMARLGSHALRWIEIFGRDAVHVLSLEALAERPEATYAGVLAFLGVDASHRPSFAAHNANKSVRSQALQGFLRRPPVGLRSVYRRLLPRTLRRDLVQPIRRALRRANVRQVPRTPLPPDERARLDAEFAEESRILADLLAGGTP